MYKRPSVGPLLLADHLPLAGRCRADGQNRCRPDSGCRLRPDENADGSPPSGRWILPAGLEMGSNGSTDHQLLGILPQNPYQGFASWSQKGNSIWPLTSHFQNPHAYAICTLPALQIRCRHCRTVWNSSGWWRIFVRSRWRVHILLERSPSRCSAHPWRWFCHSELSSGPDHRISSRH